MNTRPTYPSYRRDRKHFHTEYGKIGKMFAATGTEVDDYADVLGNRLISDINNGRANSDQLRAALEKIGESAIGG